MIEVDLPDGSVAEFPDGTPSEVMKQALKVDPSTGQPWGVPAFDPKVKGYNPETGTVEKQFSPIGSGLMGAGAAATYEFGDEITGAVLSHPIFGMGLTREQITARMRNDQAAAQAQNPGSYLTGGIAGGVAQAVAGGPVGFGANAIRSGAGMGRVALGTAADGALFGAAQGAGGGTDARSRTIGAGVGAVTGGALGAAAPYAVAGATKGVNKVAGTFNKKPPAAMTQTKLDANKNAAYDLAERAGVIIKPAGMRKLQNGLHADLANFGYDPVAHPGAKILLKSIAKAQGQNLTLKGLDTIRKQAGNVGYISGNKPNNAVVSKIVKHIDDLIDSNDTALIEGLNTAVGQQAIKIARQYAHRSFKVETANNLILKGNQMADRNITDTRVKSVKSQLGKINDPFSSWGRGYTAAEKAAAAKAATYTPGQRALHGMSVLNPFGGGKLSAASHIALAGANVLGGNVLGLAAQGAGMLAGAGFQKAGQALANKSVKEFVDLVARGGVPAPVVQNALQRLTVAKREVLTRALRAAGVVVGTKTGAPGFVDNATIDSWTP